MIKEMLTKRLQEIQQFPSAVIGIGIIFILVFLSVYTILSIPYSEAIRLWRGGEGVWIENPRHAMPVWINRLPGRNLPETIILSTEEHVQKTREVLSEALTEVTIEFEVPYTYDAFPQEITLFLTSTHEDRRPYGTFTWITPDGREIQLAERSFQSRETYRISQDSSLRRRLGGVAPHRGLFMSPQGGEDQPLKGTHRLLIEGLVFEPEADIEARLIVYGRVHGLAGTDHRRRDITIALMWGAPIALAFGFLAAVGSTITTLIIAAVGVWFGGWVDGAIQRITEVNMILPLLPILIMVGTLYSRSIWVMLGLVVLLGIFSAGIKTYRAMFLQIRESPYIEAAKAYGAGNLRIVFMYMIPKVLPVLIPQFVVLIPTYVFLEATLALLGLGDPVLPTWGKVLNDAYYQGALHRGHYYWVLMPSMLLMVTGLGFSMVGFALDRIFNPRLRRL